MPLTCDCYGGCWGDHAKERGWKSVPYTLDRWTFVINKFPYGSYVVMGSEPWPNEAQADEGTDKRRIYIEDEENVVLALMAS